MTAIISEIIPPQLLQAFRGQCLVLGATCHLREVCWKYLSEATAAGFYVGEVATSLTEWSGGKVKVMQSRRSPHQWRGIFNKIL
jgi:hypothetical protein